MCGIAGIVTLDGRTEIERLRLMCERIRHRGPDHHGTYTEQNPAFWVGIGSQRLSIIDLSEAGNQPIPNEDRSVWIAYNGELYNHQELRGDLIARGHVYRSQTDTETIVHAYEEYGLDCLRRFNGIFAFVIYDRRQQRVILARDQMGVKPLYYTWDGTTLAFSSELKSLQASTSATLSVDPVALSLYFSLGYVPSPHCMFAGVTKLMPGSYLVLENGRTTTGTYWTPQFGSPDAAISEDGALIEETRAVLEDAVRRQLMSDVPVGVFLSGGVDSTIVTALAQRFHDGPMDTFSVGFDDSQGGLAEGDLYNLDLHFARQVAEVIGTRHHEIIVKTDAGIADLLVKTINHIDEPVWESSFTSLHLMSQLARQHGVIVVLTGDGGDELFAGYPWYAAAQRFKQYSRIPFLKYGLPLLSAAAGEHILGVKARDLRRKLGQSDVTYYRFNYDIFSQSEKSTLIRPEVLAELATDPVDDFLSALMKQAEAAELSDKLVMADLLLWVREHFNQRVDRMSMMNSVEARVPLQDMEVVGLALRVPLAIKMRGKQGKYLLRKACADLLPEIVSRRPKRPFATPTQDWLRGPLRAFTLDTLAERPVRESGFLDPQQVNSVVQAFMAGNDKMAFKVWAMLNFQLWHEAYVRNPAAA